MTGRRRPLFLFLLLAALAPAAIAHADGYPRPKGASPISLSLVTGFKPCAVGNRTHGAPLAYPSCAPPARGSDTLGIGPNPQFLGRLGMWTIAGLPGPPDDSDVGISLSLTDVRCLGAAFSQACGAPNNGTGPDYYGQVQASTQIRVTDQEGTISDLPLAPTFACNATDGATYVGSDCGGSSSMNALVPGSIRDGRRMVMQVSEVQVFDGGQDGDPATPGNTVFADPGVFVP